MRISDWSSDVCSSDLRLLRQVLRRVETARRFSDMLGIVETDTKDILARARDWREQADIASGQRGADQVGGRRRRNGFPQEAQSDRPQVDKIEHRRRQILPDRIRSEEHTSELQSLMRISYAV